jgi:hypothetical protein
VLVKVHRDATFHPRSKRRSQLFLSSRAGVSNPLRFRREFGQKRGTLQRNENFQSMPSDDRKLQRPFGKIPNRRVDLLPEQLHSFQPVIENDQDQATSCAPSLDSGLPLSLHLNLKIKRRPNQQKPEDPWLTMYSPLGRRELWHELRLLPSCLRATGRGACGVLAKGAARENRASPAIGRR